MSTTSNRGLTRRSTITAMSAAAFMSGRRRLGWAAAKVAPITIVINQSPWFDSFRKTVELYEKETRQQGRARRQSRSRDRWRSSATRCAPARASTTC